MPAQHRLWAHDVHCLSPPRCQPSQEKQDQAVFSVQPRTGDGASHHEHLLSEEGVLGQELRPCPDEIPNSACG